MKRTMCPTATTLRKVGGDDCDFASSMSSSASRACACCIVSASTIKFSMVTPDPCQSRYAEASSVQVFALFFKIGAKVVRITYLPQPRRKIEYPHLTCLSTCSTPKLIYALIPFHLSRASPLNRCSAHST